MGNSEVRKGLKENSRREKGCQTCKRIPDVKESIPVIPEDSQSTRVPSSSQNFLSQPFISIPRGHWVQPSQRPGYRSPQEEEQALAGSIHQQLGGDRRGAAGVFCWRCVLCVYISSAVEQHKTCMAADSASEACQRKASGILTRPVV